MDRLNEGYSSQLNLLVTLPTLLGSQQDLEKKSWLQNSFCSIQNLCNFLQEILDNVIQTIFSLATKLSTQWKVGWLQQVYSQTLPYQVFTSLWILNPFRASRRTIIYILPLAPLCTVILYCASCITVHCNSIFRHSAVHCNSLLHLRQHRVALPFIEQHMTFKDQSILSTRYIAK